MRKRGFIRKHKRNIALILGAGALFSFGVLALWAVSLKIPDITSLETRKVEQSTKIYDRTGTVLLDDLSENMKRTVVKSDEISPYIKQATVAIEDTEFYNHIGVRPIAFLRAAIVNVLSLGFEQGGSTITQQVVKNSILTLDKTIARKVKEWILAIKLERVLTKEQILELYLNGNPYGGLIYGVEEASEQFFSKHAKDVSLAEAAYLAALPQAPTYYSPYGNHQDALDTRKNVVLSRMKELGFITTEEYEQAKAERVAFAPQATSGIRAPHFVFYVRGLLEQEFGTSALEQSGWRIITTLDADLEAKAEEIVKKRATENEKNFNAENASLVAIDPKTGDILVMAGSRDYFDPEINGAYNITLAKRQPGSSFKPFVYAASFLKGYTPDTVLFDVPTQFSTSCPPTSLSNTPPCYAPQNFDDKFFGPLTLRDALAQSRNIPALKVLYLVGINNALSLARSMGISTLAGADRYGLTLVLGGGEVTPLDMTSAYGVFANEGVRNPHRALLRIEDKDGKEIKTYPLSPERVLDQNVALNISDILSDNVARTPEFGSDSALNFPGRHVTAKTGTTNDYRDAWIMGYTPDIAVGAWAGNNDNTPMVKRIAGFIVAPLWHEFFEYALTKFPNTPFPEARALDSASDKPILRGIWQGGDVTPVDGGTTSGADVGKNRITVSVHSILFWLNKDDPRGAPPSNPNEDPQFARWEWGVRNWATQHGLVDGTTIIQ
ncbi:MAG: transglycosylase domain-containing protein [Patescibacteria group bacterium]